MSMILSLRILYQKNKFFQERFQKKSKIFCRFFYRVHKLICFFRWVSFTSQCRYSQLVSALLNRMYIPWKPFSHGITATKISPQTEAAVSASSFRCGLLPWCLPQRSCWMAVPLPQKKSGSVHCRNRIPGRPQMIRRSQPAETVKRRCACCIFRSEEEILNANWRRAPTG